MRQRYALVTGAQQGIGAAAAIALARGGADIAINYLDDKPAAEKVAQQVEEAGRRAVLIQGDIGTAAGPSAWSSRRLTHSAASIS